MLYEVLMHCHVRPCSSLRNLPCKTILIPTFRRQDPIDSEACPSYVQYGFDLSIIYWGENESISEAILARIAGSIWTLSHHMVQRDETRSTMVFEKLFCEAYKRKAKSLLVQCCPDTDGGGRMKFYQSHGFRQVGV